VVGGEVEDVTGAVINPGQYLDVCPLGEPVVGEVGLPGFVGHGGFEPDVGRLGFLVGFGGDEARLAEVAADCRGRDGDAVVGGEVPGDGVGAGVEPCRGEVFAQLEDEFYDVWGCFGGGGVGFPGARFEGLRAFVVVAGDEFRDPAF